MIMVKKEVKVMLTNTGMALQVNGIKMASYTKKKTGAAAN